MVGRQKTRFKSVGKVEEFRAENPRIIEIEDKVIGVYFYQGHFLAYENVCPHEGGPACEGLVIGNTEVTRVPGDLSSREILSDEDLNIACPWHGVEYDLKTGICKANKYLCLNKFEVKVRDGTLEIGI